MGKKNKFVIAENNNIRCDVAKRVVNWNGCILNKEILKKLQINDIVRISMHVSKKSNYCPKIYKDSPYIKIKEIKGNYMLGEILDVYRHQPDNNYPLRIGEHIWIQFNNIIEIPLQLYNRDDMNSFNTNEYVRHTGPLETIDSDNSDFGSSDESSDSESSQEIDMSKFDERIH